MKWLFGRTKPKKPMISEPSPYRRLAFVSDCFTGRPGAASSATLFVITPQPPFRREALHVSPGDVQLAPQMRPPEGSGSSPENAPPVLSKHHHQRGAVHQASE